MISRFESGIYPIRRVDAMALLDLSGVEDPKQREILRRLADDVWQKGRWDRYSGQVDGSLIDLVWLESRTVAIRAFSQTSLIFLLQTQAYTEALIHTADPDAEKARIGEWVDLRMSRQRILDGDEPVRLSVVVDEAVLRRSIGGPEVMASQLRHLAKRAARPNIDLRVRSGPELTPALTVGSGSSRWRTRFPKSPTSRDRRARCTWSRRKLKGCPTAAAIVSRWAW